MKQAGPGLPEWVDQCGQLLRCYFDKPQHWQAARDRAMRDEACDFNARLKRTAANGLRRALLLIAWNMACHRLRPDGTEKGRDLVLWPSWMEHAIGWWALGAADYAEPIMADHWGNQQLSAGLPQLKAGRTKRAVQKALAARRPGETMSDVLARAGVSRAHGYRILDKKDRR